MSMFYAAIPGMPELGMVWMGDMMVQGEQPHQELMLDPRQQAQDQGNFYAHTAQSFDDIRNHHMVRYVPSSNQFSNDCSEAEDPMESLETIQGMQQDYDAQNMDDMNGYFTLEAYMAEKEQEQAMNNAATQTQESRNRKIKPIKHPGLVLKTPIAYQPSTDLNFIPIREDGRGVCEKCGAIGVKHSFYTKERRFCSRECARSSEHANFGADSTNNLQRIADPPTPERVVQEKVRRDPPKLNPIIKEEEVEDERSSPASETVSEFNSKPILTPEPVLLESLPMRKKRSAEMAGSYDWIPHFSEPGFCAAPVPCFKHAPIVEIWDTITVGMKVEVENTDCDDSCDEFPGSFWVATVLRIFGYRALLRYEGFGHNSDKDFWVSLCSNDIHPVGWCAPRGKPLIAPKTISHMYENWRNFLVKHLLDRRTLPEDFHSKVTESFQSRFRVGLLLEVVDKNRISQVKVATVQKIVGKRLHVRYYDSDLDDGGFWCHEDSPLIHPVGWAKRVGHTLNAYDEYLERMESGEYNEDDATNELFRMPRSYNANFAGTFQEGMKIEAIDPLNLSAICAATVMRVLKENYIMIRIDSYDEDINGADWFCYNTGSPCIFPVGFCFQHGISLTPPKGYDPLTFSWDTYLEETKAVPAPGSEFSWDEPQHGFIEGMRLEAADLMDPRLVCVATITRVIGRLLRVHFDGWEDEYDQWLDCQSPDIYPVGWCDLVDHRLEGPRSAKHSNSLLKTPRGLKRRGKRKVKKNLRIPRTTLTRQSERQNMMQRQNKSEAEDEMDMGPTQGTLIEQERNSESIPEPEPAEEPAGPDQTLPSSASDTLKEEPTSVPTEKFIPKMTVGLQKASDVVQLVPLEWNIFDVAQFLRINDCAAYCENFSKRKIDGKALLELTKEQIIDLTGFKVGPSLKIYDLIQQLKNKVNPTPDRLKLGFNKKVL